ncbi:MAG: hypothetical protein NT066_02565 [Candidatus Omnitrophica bacterium]|nr:hypothetical protein [Candidatus Omnitrophota bacterium]
MRDLLFKNLTSTDGRRKIIASSEIVDKKGVRSIIRRHFVCLVKEVNGQGMARPSSYLYVLKERNTKEQREKFFCRLKGSLYAISGHKIFLIIFMHSLRINLVGIPEDSQDYVAEDIS